jgi:hypothetical protein
LNKVPREVADRLIVPSRRLVLPEDRRNWPHPDTCVGIGKISSAK